LRSLTLPIPSHDLHCAPGGTVLPAPWQVEHVLAIWKPELITKVCVPDPRHVWHVCLVAPAFKPEPSHVWQSIIGVKFTVRVVPLQASTNGIETEASRSSPLGGPAFRARPAAPPKSVSNSCSSALPLPGRPKGAPKPNPPKPPKPPLLKALASKPGCCEAAPYVSYSFRFFSSPRIYVGPTTGKSASEARMEREK
jgi:hypothetical protein